MRKITAISAVCALAISAYASDLGNITVESSTIDIKSSKATEVSNINIIDEERLEVVDPKNLTEVLQTIPGVTSISRTNEMMQIRFRGVGQQQFMGEKPGVAIIVDGVPVMAKSGGIRINMADIKSIKVIKGSASYLYGDTALSGALVITTKKPKGKNESTVRTEVGSYGYKELELGSIYSKENFAINLNASKRMSDGYWTESESWTQSVNGKFSYYIDDTSDITLGIDITEKYDQAGSRGVVGGVTEAEENPQGEGDESYTKDSGIDLNKYFLSYSKDFGENNLNITAYKYDDLYEQTTNPQDLDSDPATANVYVNHANEDLKQQGLKSEYTIKGKNFASLIGIEYAQRDYENFTETLADYSAYNSRTASMENYYADETSYTNSNEDTKAIYGEFKYNITSSFTTTLNARYNIQTKEYISQKYDYNGTAWSDIYSSDTAEFKNTAYRLGATYNYMENHTVFASVSTGFENPEADDLADSPDLKEQTSVNYEIGSRGKGGMLNNTFNYELSIFQLDNKDILGPEGGTYAFSDPMDNIGDTRSRGLELSLSSDKKKMLSFDFAYTYLDAKYTEHNPFTILLRSPYTSYDIDIIGNTVPRVSKHTANLFAYYNPTDKLKIIANIFAKSSYYADEGNMVKFDGYELLNLQTRYNSKLFSNDIEYFIKVDNVLDDQYYRAAFLHSDKRGNPDGTRDGLITNEDASITVDPGRVFYAGINYKF